MKRIVSSCVLIVLMATIGCIVASAQEAQKGQLWFCWEATVHPEMQSQFIDLQNDFHSKFKEHGFPYTMYTWTDRHFGYYFFYPVDSYDDKSQIYDALWATLTTGGEENFNRMWLMVMSHRTYFLQSLPELSYNPEQPRLDAMDIPYAYWDILYVKPEKEMEFVELNKKLQGLHQAQSFDDPVQIFAGDIGYEGSVYIAGLVGKDAVDFRVQNQKMWEQMGDEGAAIFEKMKSLLKKTRVQRILVSGGAIVFSGVKSPFPAYCKLYHPFARKAAWISRVMGPGEPLAILCPSIVTTGVTSLEVLVRNISLKSYRRLASMSST